MKRAIAMMLLCLVGSCIDRTLQRRADLDARYRDTRKGLYRAECESGCGGVFDTCIRKIKHSSGACYQHYNDCMRDCMPERKKP